MGEGGQTYRHTDTQTYRHMTWPGLGAGPSENGKWIYVGLNRGHTRS